MASSSSSSMASMPLKGKLNQVSYLLEDANKRIQEEASKYEIFTTKTSASTQHHQQAKNNNIKNNLPTDLIRTMSDINSLDKLSYQLNLHPSIGPADINIDANGELILAPPIEPTSLNNLINSKLDECSVPSNNSPRIVGSNIIKTTEIRHENNNFVDDQQVQMLLKNASHYPTNGSSDRLDSTNGFATQNQDQQNHIMQHQLQQHQQRYASQEQINLQHQSTLQSYVPSSDLIPSSMNAYDTEKLVLNGKTRDNKPAKRHHQTKLSSETGSASMDGEGHRLYKSNGHFKLDQVTPNDVVVVASANLEARTTDPQFMNRQEEGGRNGYSNELYKAAHELTPEADIVAMEHHHHHHQIQTQLTGQIHVTQSNTIGNNNNGSLQQAKNTHGHLTGPNGKSIQPSGVQYNRGSCSPSTSAGSTVRLADECDSGASSYQSQTAKGTGTPYSSYPYKSNEQIDAVESRITSSTPTQGARNAAPVEDKVESIEHELVPGMQRIEVVLERDENGLGIEIAGYTCEKEEISGIFIKSVTPNSPAGRSGQIRSLDQIFAVNGQEILSYSNPEAVNFLRRTGKIVTLELRRYIAESKYRKLQNVLSRVKPSLNSDASTSLSPIPAAESDAASMQNNSSNVIASPAKSSIPISKMRETNLSPARQTLVQVNNSNSFVAQKELIYKNGPLCSSLDHRGEPEATNQSQIPVAAQRGGTNKVIETKQGARNTIDIRSPAGYATTTTTATYVNKVAELEFAEATKKSITARLQREASDEFGRLIRSEEPEWEKDAQIIEIYKDVSQGLGFTVKEYANPKDPKQTIIMITSITPDGIAERDGRLSFGDLLIFVDDTDLKGASLTETVKALKKTNGQVRLGVRKLKRA